MSVELVARLSRVVDRSSSRRGFLGRSAMGATALAVAPVTYVTRPTTAYAAICDCAGSACDCGAACCDGYTDFCCALTGENLCPPGTVVAGWWKADGSGFCDTSGPRPRYYLDCNHVCADGCGCGTGGICAADCTAANCRCMDGCGSRKVDCTEFRYGQCNQHIACVGSIACRVVTCVPPWQWDHACGPAVARDDNTRSHDRPCLHEGFTDVAPDEFYTAAVEWMVEAGITTGITDDLFGPAEPTQRAQFATFLWRYRGSPGGHPSAGFDDVPDDLYFAPAVSWLVANGITTGTSPTEFSPRRTISRAETVTLLWRLAGEPLASGPGFGDVAATDWFHDAVAWASASGITTGIAPGVFGPGLALSRAEAATFLHRFHLAGFGSQVTA